MNFNHHPDDATLTSFAASALEGNFASIVDLHLDQCPSCQQRLRQAEQLGGQMFEQLPLASVDQQLKQKLMSQLGGLPTSAPEPEISLVDPLPDYLNDWQETDFDQLEWRSMAPGISQIKLPCSSGSLNLLRIQPGVCIPPHGHNGNELTMVLRGSFSDEIGRFTPGSVADLDDEIDHQPIADRDQPCICLVATDAPLRFHGWVPRLMQRLVSL